MRRHNSDIPNIWSLSTIFIEAKLMSNLLNMATFPKIVKYFLLFFVIDQSTDNLYRGPVSSSPPQKCTGTCKFRLLASQK